MQVPVELCARLCRWSWTLLGERLSCVQRANSILPFFTRLHSVRFVQTHFIALLGLSFLCASLCRWLGLLLGERLSYVQ